MVYEWFNNLIKFVRVTPSSLKSICGCSWRLKNELSWCFLVYHGSYYVHSWITLVRKLLLVWGGWLFSFSLFVFMLSLITFHNNLSVCFSLGFGACYFNCYFVYLSWFIEYNFFLNFILYFFNFRFGFHSFYF